VYIYGSTEYIYGSKEQDYSALFIAGLYTDDYRATSFFDSSSATDYDLTVGALPGSYTDDTYATYLTYWDEIIDN
jgi:hypothetical protein